MNAQRHKSPVSTALVPLLLLGTILALALGPSAPGMAQTPEAFALTRDFGATTYEHSSISTAGAQSFRGAVAAGPFAFFHAYTPATGYEVWRTDGSEAGTILLGDLCPGDDDQFPSPTFTALGPQVFFPASDCVSGRELWVSDGTPGGTRRVKDINPGPYGSNAEDFFVVAGRLFFTAYDGTSHRIWKSDGSAAGTTSTGVSGSPIFGLGDGLFFTSSQGGSCAIRRLDANTSAVSTLAAFCPRSIYPSGMGGIAIAAGPSLAYFTYGDAATGVEVWRTDGTPPGTFLLQDIYPGPETSRPADFFVDASDRLFFAARDNLNGEELWTSNGTPAGTQLVKNINPGAASSGPNQFTLWNSRVYFSAYDGTQIELWRTNGTSAGTTMVVDLTPAAGTSSYPGGLTATLGALFFVADDATHDNALFRTDGSGPGTVLVKDIHPTATSGEIGGLSALGNSIVFLGDDGDHGGEPWLSDGTPGGTRMIKNIAGAETQSSRPSVATPLHGRVLYFGWNVEGGSSSNAYALYRSDGSPGGTEVVQDFYRSPEDDYDLEHRPAVFAGALYFGAEQSSGSGGVELWRSDGAGASLFVEIVPGPGGGDPSWLRPSGPNLYFRAGNSTYGEELWKTGGTPETTALVYDINPGPSSSYPEHLTPDGAGGVYFSANDGVAGGELWHSDGTSAGTRRWADLNPGSSSSSPEQLTLAGTRLYFTAKDSTAGRELWITEGTPESTRRVRDINPGPGDTSFGPYQRPFAARGGAIFFVAATDLFGAELWTSDGSESGTRIVKDVFPGPAASNIDELTVLGDLLYFVASGDADTRTLWRSDGTTAGTYPVVAGPGAPVAPQALSASDGRLYFSAADPARAAGRELWVSDGSAEGTLMLQDLNPGPDGSTPYGVVRAGNRLYLAAYQPGAGIELWSARVPSVLYLPLVRR